MPSDDFSFITDNVKNLRRSCNHSSLRVCTFSAGLMHPYLDEEPLFKYFSHKVRNISSVYGNLAAIYFLINLALMKTKLRPPGKFNSFLRYPILIKVLDKLKSSDIMCFQHVANTPSNEKLLSNCFKDHGLISYGLTSNFYGDGLSILFDQNKLLLDSHQLINFKKPSSFTPGRTGTAYIKARFLHTPTLKILNVYNVRLRDGSSNYRHQCIDQLLDDVLNISPDSSCLIFMDLNAPMKSLEFSRLQGFNFGDRFLSEAYAYLKGEIACEEVDFTQHNFSPLDPLVRFKGRNDLIFYSSDFVATSIKTIRDSCLGIYPSYHYPVVATISAIDN